MEFQSSNSLYGFPQALTRVFPAPVIAQRNPTTADFKYPTGQVWVNEDGENAYILVEVNGNSAVWSLMASVNGTIETLTTDSGVVTPLNDNVNLSGTTNQITVSGASDTVTYSLPNTVVVPGTLQVTSGTTLAALTQVGTASINATGGASTFIGSENAGPIVINSAGNTALNSSGGNVLIDTTGGSIIIGQTGITQTLSFGTGAGNKTVTIGTTNGTSTTNIRAGSGGVNVTGNLSLTTSGNQLRVKGGAAADFIGTVTLTAGGASILNSAITANDRIFLQRINSNTSTATGDLIYTIIPSTGFDIFSVDPSSPGSDITADVSTIAYFIVRQI